MHNQATTYGTSGGHSGQTKRQDYGTDRDQVELRVGVKSEEMIGDNFPPPPPAPTVNRSINRSHMSGPDNVEEGEGIMVACSAKDSAMPIPSSTKLLEM